jgi:hypothetical protein
MMKMRGAAIALVFISILALQLSGTAEVTVTDADGVFERDLSEVAIPTYAEPVTKIFNFNQNAVSVEDLVAVEIETEPLPISDVFVVNEQASTEGALVPTVVPTRSEPLEVIFILHEGAKAFSPLTYPVDMVGDSRPPVISNVTVTGVTASSAEVYWETDEFSNGLVEYGTAPGIYTDQSFDEFFALNHTLILEGLVPETTYRFAVTATDRSGNSGQSAEYDFATAGL